MLVSNLGLAFIAHYNAPAFYSSLTDPTPRRFGLSVCVAFACLTLLYMACMGLGYYTFGDAAASNIMLTLTLTLTLTLSLTLTLTLTLTRRRLRLQHHA